MKTKNKLLFSTPAMILTLGVIIGLVLIGIKLAAADNSNNDCLAVYGTCVEESRKLPGSVYDKPMSSPFTRAWAACSAQSTACENAKRAARSATPPAANSQSASNSFLTGAPTNVKIASFTGDVEYRRRGETGNRPLTKDVVLQPGDFITTGFEGKTTLKIGNQQLEIYQLSQVRVDEFLNEANLKRTQLYLLVGNVQAKVKHTAAIRSDFSVSTTIANASIRGSAMTVHYDENTGMKVYVTDDAAVVRSNNGTENTVQKGYMVSVAPDGRQSAPVKFKKSDLSVIRKR